MARPREVTDEKILESARKCFIQHGASISAVEIGKSIGISHTTIFNRFGSKEALLIAALSPPKNPEWIEELNKGPDERPVKEQLLRHCLAMLNYFLDIQAGFAILQGAGISREKLFHKRMKESGPVRTFRTLKAWLKQAQEQQLIADCNIETLTNAIIAVLHNQRFMEKVCRTEATLTPEQYVEDFIDLIWVGIGEPS